MSIRNHDVKMLFLFILSFSTLLMAEDIQKPQTPQMQLVDSLMKSKQEIRILLETLRKNIDTGEHDLEPLLRLNIDIESLDTLIQSLPIPDKFEFDEEGQLFEKHILPYIFGEEKQKKIERKGIVEFGGDVLIGRNEIIMGDVVLFGGNAKIYGEVEGGVVSVFGDVHLASTSEIHEEVVCLWGNMKTEEGARIHGESVIFNLGNLFKNSSGKMSPLSTIFIIRVLRFILLLLFVWIITIAFPKQVHRIQTCLSKEYAKSLIFGFIGLFLLPVIFLVLLATIIGIPVAILALPLITLAAFILGFTGFVLLLSNLLTSGRDVQITSTFLLVAIGVFILELPQLLSKLFIWISPTLGSVTLIFGILVFFAAWVPGFGAVIMTKFGKEDRLKSDNDKVQQINEQK